MNVDDNLADEEDVVRVALDFLAQMCDPNVLETDKVFWVTTNDGGEITLEDGEII
jgi:hypothetical protein